MMCPESEILSNLHDSMKRITDDKATITVSVDLLTGLNRKQVQDAWLALITIGNYYPTDLESLKLFGQNAFYLARYYAENNVIPKFNEMNFEFDINKGVEVNQELMRVQITNYMYQVALPNLKAKAQDQSIFPEDLSSIEVELDPSMLDRSLLLEAGRVMVTANNADVYSKLPWVGCIGLLEEKDGKKVISKVFVGKLPDHEKYYYLKVVNFA